MTAYDAVMIGLIALGLLWGVLRGFTWQVASLASLGVGFVSSHQLSARIAPYLPGEPLVARSLSMLVAYVLVSGLIFVAAWMVRATIRKLRFEAYDRHLGMLLGGLEAAFVGILGTFFVVSLAPSTRGPIFESPTGKIVGQLMSNVGPVLPEEARAVLAPIWEGKPSRPPDSKLVDSWIDDATKSLSAAKDEASKKLEAGTQDWWEVVGNKLDDRSERGNDLNTQKRPRSDREGARQIGRRGETGSEREQTRRR